MLFCSGYVAPERPRPRSTIHDLPASLFWKEIERLNGTPDAVLRNPELMKLVEPALRADFAACETYVYRDEAPLDCPIAAFRGIDDPNTNVEGIGAWQRQTEAGFSTSVFAGDHFFIVSERSRVLAAIRREMRTQLGLVLPEMLGESVAA